MAHNKVFQLTLAQLNASVSGTIDKMEIMRLFSVGMMGLLVLFDGEPKQGDTNIDNSSYGDSRKITRVEDDEEWRNLVIGALRIPALERNSEDEAYGLLYNFFAVSDCGGLCPDGWHIPSADDWRELIDFLGGVDVAGGKMKATSSNSWRIMIQGTNNNSGFAALPAGGRGQVGGAGELGYYATWWSSTLEDSLFAGIGASIQISMG